LPPPPGRAGALDHPHPRHGLHASARERLRLPERPRCHDRSRQRQLHRLRAPPEDRDRRGTRSRGSVRLSRVPASVLCPGPGPDPRRRRAPAPAPRRAGRMTTRHGFALGTALGALLVAGATLASEPPRASAASEVLVYSVTLNDALFPISAAYLKDSFKKANEGGAGL